MPVQADGMSVCPSRLHILMFFRVAGSLAAYGAMPTKCRFRGEAMARLVTGLLRRCRERVVLGLAELGESGFEQRGDLLKGVSKGACRKNGKQSDRRPGFLLLALLKKKYSPIAAAGWGLPPCPARARPTPYLPLLRSSLPKAGLAPIRKYWSSHWSTRRWTTFPSASDRLSSSSGLIPHLGYRVRTLHGLAHDIVREKPGRVGLEERFSIIDEREADFIRREAVNAWLASHPGYSG